MVQFLARWNPRLSVSDSNHGLDLPILCSVDEISYSHAQAHAHAQCFFPRRIVDENWHGGLSW